MLTVEAHKAGSHGKKGWEKFTDAVIKKISDERQEVVFMLWGGYAKKKGVDASKWNLVTGDKKQIYELARKSYLAVKDDGDGGPFDMIHTENFMLIDKKKQIRGFYDGTDPEDISRLLDDIQILKQEYTQ